LRAETEHNRNLLVERQQQEYARQQAEIARQFAEQEERQRTIEMQARELEELAFAREKAERMRDLERDQEARHMELELARQQAQHARMQAEFAAEQAEASRLRRSQNAAAMVAARVSRAEALQVQTLEDRGRQSTVQEQTKDKAYHQGLLKRLRQWRFLSTCRLAQHWQELQAYMGLNKDQTAPSIPAKDSTLQLEVGQACRTRLGVHEAVWTAMQAADPARLTASAGGAHRSLLDHYWEGGAAHTQIAAICHRMSRNDGLVRAVAEAQARLMVVVERLEVLMQSFLGGVRLDDFLIRRKGSAGFSPYPKTHQMIQGAHEEKEALKDVLELLETPLVRLVASFLVLRDHRSIFMRADEINSGIRP